MPTGHVNWLAGKCKSCEQEIHINVQLIHDPDAWICLDCKIAYDTMSGSSPGWTSLNQDGWAPPTKKCSCGAHAIKIDTHDSYCVFYHPKQFLKPEYR